MAVTGQGQLYSSPMGVAIVKADYTSTDYSITGLDPSKKGRPARWLMFIGGICVVKLAGAPDDDVTLTADFASMVLPYQVASIDNTSTATNVIFGW